MVAAAVEMVTISAAELAALRAENTRLKQALETCREANVRLTARNNELLQSQRMHKRILKQPKEVLSPTDKVVWGWAQEHIRQEQSSGHVRPDGAVLMPAWDAEKDLGISRNTIGRSVDRLETLGLWEKKHVWHAPEWDPQGAPVQFLYVKPNKEVMQRPELIATAAPEAPQRMHGGKRTITVKVPDVCDGCGGETFQIDYTVTCVTCGTIVAKDTIPDITEPASPENKPLHQDGASTSPVAFEDENDPPCIATSDGQHVYAQLRTADYRRICVECDIPERVPLLRALGAMQL